MPKSVNLLSRKFQFIIGVGAFVAFMVFGAFLRVNSQGDTTESYPKGFRGNTCTVETETLIIGYSSYYLPGNNEKVSGADHRTAHMPVQCGKIPKPGMFNIAIDLLYPRASRDVPFSLRLFKLVWIDDKSTEEIEVLSIPAQAYSSGVITHSFKLDEEGQYFVYLEGKGLDNVDYHLQVPITVGHNWRDSVRNFLPPFFRRLL